MTIRITVAEWTLAHMDIHPALLGVGLVLTLVVIVVKFSRKGRK